MNEIYFTNIDFTPILVWWFVILIIGLLGWPLAFSWLRFLPDRGFALARPVGFLVIGYILWLGATFRLLQNNFGGILITIVLVAAIAFIWHRHQVQVGLSPSMLSWLKREWRYALTVELLFNLAFISWVYFKLHNPNIETAGGEKWMEIAFINGILNSAYFPPQDPWLSGFGISYYYFGYVLMTLATQMTGLISTIAFNLYIPTLFAMTLTAAFGIVANLVTLYRRQLPLASPPSYMDFPAAMTGLLASLFVALLGNLIGVFEVLHKRGLLPAEFWLWLDIRDLKNPPPGSEGRWLPEGFTLWQGGFDPEAIQANLTLWIPDRFIWWWRGSRVLTDYNLTGHEQEVIDEFPFFSFLLGDVHPHVLALPFVLLVTALALNLLLNPAQWLVTPGTLSGSALDKLGQLLKNSWQELRTATGGITAFLLYALAIGGLSFLNTWDFPIYLSIVGLTFITWVAQRKHNLSAALWPAVIGVGILAVSSIILYLPFYATFQSQAKGILPNLWNPTRLTHFFVFFGPFLVAAIVLLLVLTSQDKGWPKQFGWTLPLTILGPILVMIIILSGVLINPAGREYLDGILRNPEVQALIGNDTIAALIQESLWRRLITPGTFLLLGSLLGLTLALLVNFSDSVQYPGQNWLVEKFVLILLLVGLGLPLVVEFIYLRDNFGIRMNTIFKFYFQAWVLLALASAFALYYVSKNLTKGPCLLWQGTMLLLIIGAMIYPLLATFNKTNNFQNEPTLNGIEWISDRHPGDYAAIEWLRENAYVGSVILEAPGSGYASYQYTSRISAMTGLPTLLGWGGHQSQWRGNYDEPARREPEIDLLFNTSDLQQTQQLLDKYNITYVYIGSLEREHYSPQGLNKFEKIMNPVFQQHDVIIYKR